MLTRDQLVDMGIPPESYDSLSDLEKQAVNEMLAEITTTHKTSLLDQLYYTDYDEIPVDFITFITDDNYLGRSTKNGTAIFPFWKKEGQYIYSRNDINEVAVSGSIGTGKTTFSMLLMAYHLYKTMCLRNPQEFFGLTPGSEITYAFLNNTLTSSYGVGYKTIQAFLMESPWFLKHGKLVGRAQEEYQPEKGFGFVVGSRPQHTLGKHIICATIDEVSFAPGQDVQYERSKIMSIYTNIKRRMESRFMVQGHMYGLMLLVSSKATESSFLEAYIADQVKKGYPIYVIDQPLWKVKPRAYSGKFFKVAVGNKYLPSRIVPDGSSEEYVESLKKQGLNIIDVPIEHKQAFDQDIDKALQDIAGISTSVVTKAFSSQKVLEATSETLENPFATEIVTLGKDDQLQLQDFFIVERIPDYIYGMPVFVHLDASVKGDRTGLAATAIVGTRQSLSTNEITEDQEVVDELVCQEVFHVGIQAPSDSEISFEKTRRFIYWLRDEVGLKIKLFSSDGFQSVDTRQLLSAKGFEVKYTSLDRTPDGYDGLRSAIYDKRMILLKGGPKLFEELTELERDNMTLKYDHPAYSSKDISDAVAGSHMDAMGYKEEFMFFHPDDYAYEELNGSKSEEDRVRESMITSMTQNKEKKKSPPSVEDIFGEIENSSYYGNSNILLL